MDTPPRATNDLVIDLICPVAPADALEIDALIVVGLQPSTMISQVVTERAFLRNNAIRWDQRGSTIRPPDVSVGGALFFGASLTWPTPFTSFLGAPLWARGNAALWTIGSIIAVTIQGCTTNPGGNAWRWAEDSTPSLPIRHQIVARRRRGHRLPGGS
jgi:hypothetical protein